MAGMIINGYKIKVDWYDDVLNTFLSLWDGYGESRKIPRNNNTFFYIALSAAIALGSLPLLWLASHVPFIWPEALGGMVAIICVCIGYQPYQDCFRPLIVLIIACLLLHFKITFDATIFEFHIEKYFYYIAIGAALFTLWRRFYNWVCWKQIDRICDKYAIPRYDQKALMDAYEGYDTDHGENVTTYSSYKEAVNAENQQTTTEAKE